MSRQLLVIYLFWCEGVQDHVWWQCGGDQLPLRIPGALGHLLLRGLQLRQRLSFQRLRRGRFPSYTGKIPVNLTVPVPAHFLIGRNNNSVFEPRF
jgi:hypothetical protein